VIFPSGDEPDHADYWDFVYFSFVIGMAAQVSDVGITDKTIRRTATAHGIISFVLSPCFQHRAGRLDGQYRGKRHLAASRAGSRAHG
jgi:Protein of unknown function (DUF1345)